MIKAGFFENLSNISMNLMLLPCMKFLLKYIKTWMDHGGVEYAVVFAFNHTIAKVRFNSRYVY